MPAPTRYVPDEDEDEYAQPRGRRQGRVKTPAETVAGG
jgi:hypothetical protein